MIQNPNFKNVHFPAHVMEDAKRANYNYDQMKKYEAAMDDTEKSRKLVERAMRIGGLFGGRIGRVLGIPETEAGIKAMTPGFAMDESHFNTYHTRHEKDVEYTEAGIDLYLMMESQPETATAETSLSA